MVKIIRPPPKSDLRWKELAEVTMAASEEVLEELRDLKRLNKILMSEIVIRRKSRFTPDEDSMMIRFYVACELEREAERWEIQKLLRIKGGFEHECWF
jgi:hypothetical protein